MVAASENVMGVERRDKVMVTWVGNTSEGIEATIEGIARFYELRKEGQYA